MNHDPQLVAIIGMLFLLLIVFLFLLYMRRQFKQIGKHNY